MESLSLTPEDAVSLLTRRIRALAEVYRQRVAVGIAGWPGTGKSTLAADLVATMNQQKPGLAVLVPMDGFHMRHAKLEAMGTVADKGAPHTFEGAAFAEFLNRLKTATGDVSGPGYSREIEDVVDDAFVVPAAARVLVVEGNYLLLADPPWDGVKRLLEFSVFIGVPREKVRNRLLKRHAEHGLFTEERNIAHVDNVDLANYDLVLRSRPRANLAIDLVTPL